MNTWKLKVHLIAEEIFQFLLITYLILLLIEIIQDGFVSYFFNLSILLWIVVLNGLVILLTHDEKLVVPSRNKKFNTTYTLLLILGSSLMIYSAHPIADIITIIITFVTAVILTFLALLAFSEEK